jgi:hypothetical protein
MLSPYIRAVLGLASAVAVARAQPALPDIQQPNPGAPLPTAPIAPGHEPVEGEAYVILLLLFLTTAVLALVITYALIALWRGTAGAGKGDEPEWLALVGLAAALGVMYALSEPLMELFRQLGCGRCWIDRGGGVGSRRRLDALHRNRADAQSVFRLELLVGASRRIRRMPRDRPCRAWARAPHETERVTGRFPPRSPQTQIGATPHYYGDGVRAEICPTLMLGTDRTAETVHRFLEAAQIGSPAWGKGQGLPR